jgi:hypothetical protein
MADRIEDITAVTKISAVQNPQLDTGAHTPKGVLGISDKAELSLTAQARLLRERGATVDEIASQLGLTVAIVQGDLGVDRDTTPNPFTAK